MGGFGSGGSRSGAGRKKKASHLRGIDGGAGRRGAGDDQAPDERPIGAAGDASAVLEAPATLGPVEFAVWREWAPLAHAAGTLTASTRANFVQLCQAEADRLELRGRYLPRRSETGELLPLLMMGSKEELAIRREHRTLLKDIHARMKDFMIAPFGKEIDDGAGGETDVDPLDAFTRKRG